MSIIDVIKEYARANEQYRDAINELQVVTANLEASAKETLAPYDKKVLALTDFSYEKRLKLAGAVQQEIHAFLAQKGVFAEGQNGTPDPPCCRVSCE